MLRLAFLFILTFMSMAATPVFAMTADATAPHGVEVQQAADGTYPDQIDAEYQMSTAHEVEDKGGLPQFDPSTYTSQVFWLVIAFGVLYLFFSKKTLPQIGAVLQTREDHIQRNLDAAQQLKDRAEKARMDYEQALSEAQAKSAALFAQIDQDVKNDTARAIESFQSKAAGEIQGTEQSIEKAKKEAMENIHGVAAEVARLAAEKIVGISTDIDQAKTAVQKIYKKAA